MDLTVSLLLRKNCGLVKLVLTSNWRMSEETKIAMKCYLERKLQERSKATAHKNVTFWPSKCSGNRQICPELITVLQITA